MKRRDSFWRLLGLALMSSGLALLLLTAGGNAAAAQSKDRRLGEPVTYENLSLFPVLSQQAGQTSGFVTLDEALASGDAVVTERGSEILRRSREGERRRPISMQIPIPEGPRVNELVLVYRGAKPLVLLAGELLSGGKQDRVIAKDRIVPPGAPPLPLDVFCVEQGRWSTGMQFSAAKIMVHPSVREKAAVDQKQAEVWSAVRSGTTASRGAVNSPSALSADAIAGVIGREAPSEAYAKIYQSTRVAGSVENFAEEIQRRFARATANLKGERVLGVVVAYGGEVAWSDVFASPALFERYWPKLLRSYVVEALARPQTQERASLDDAREFLRPLDGRESVESEPGVYRWRQVTQGRYAEIELEALKPAPLTLHWLKVRRTS